MIGLYGRTHFELEKYVDMETFDDIQIDVWKGMALAKSITHRGQYFNNADNSLISKPWSEFGVYPVSEAYKEYNKLPDDSKIKIVGEEIRAIDNSAFLEFLKYAYRAHDSISLYPFWNTGPGWKDYKGTRELSNVAAYFPSLIKWIDNLDIFSFIGRAYIVSIESGGLSFEHTDLPADPTNPTISDFIHIRPDLVRPFYVYDNDTKEKHYIKTRVGWFNDKDVHGGDVVNETSYSLRIDGIFTDEFRTRIINEH